MLALCMLAETAMHAAKRQVAGRFLSRAETLKIRAPLEKRSLAATGTWLVHHLSGNATHMPVTAAHAQLHQERANPRVSRRCKAIPRCLCSSSQLFTYRILIDKRLRLTAYYALGRSEVASKLASGTPSPCVDVLETQAK